MWLTVVQEWLKGAMAKYRWVKLGVMAVAVVLLIVIFAWPQKIGDSRTGEDGRVEIYYRSPNPEEPGRWLPRNEKFSEKDRVATNATEMWGLKIKDRVKINGGKMVLLLEDDTVVVLPYY